MSRTNYILPHSGIREIAKDLASSIKTAQPQLVRANGNNSYTVAPLSPKSYSFNTKDILKNSATDWEFEFLGLSKILSCSAYSPMLKQFSDAINLEYNKDWVLQAINDRFPDTLLAVQNSDGRDYPNNYNRGIDSVVNLIFGLVEMYAYGFPFSKDKVVNYILKCKISSLFHNDFPEIVSLSLKNSGNYYSLNEVVFADAYQNLTAYTRLYAINNLLGFLWMPYFRKEIFSYAGKKLTYTKYACYVHDYLIEKLRLTPNGVRNLYALSASKPTFFKTITSFLFNNSLEKESSALIRFLNHSDNISRLNGYQLDLLYKIMRNELHYSFGKNIKDLIAYLEMSEIIRKKLGKQNACILNDWIVNTVVIKENKAARTMCDFKKRHPKTWKSKVVQWAVNHSDRWHRDVEAADRIRLANEYASMAEQKWEPLPKLEPDDKYAAFSITELTNALELTLEGNTMRHCVSSYAGYCLSGKSHIFSVKENEKHSSTLELRLRNKSWAVNTNLGYQNTHPDKNNTEAVAAFVAKLNRGLKINSDNKRLDKRK